MSVMSAAGPRIDSTAEELRIKFPGLPRWRTVVSLVLMPLFLAGWWKLEWKLGTSSARGGVIVGCFAVFYVSAFLFKNGRYSLIFSEKCLAIRQQSPVLRRTKWCPLREIRNLHLRYDPTGKKPKQWELLFEKKGDTYTLPVPLTLLEAQRIRDAIYSRFPQLVPERPFFWQI